MPYTPMTHDYIGSLRLTAPAVKIIIHSPRISPYNIIYFIANTNWYGRCNPRLQFIIFLRLFWVKQLFIYFSFYLSNYYYYVIFGRSAAKSRMNKRRQSYSSSLSSGSGAGEPLIVVEESTLAEEDDEFNRGVDSPPCSLDPDSPSINPYLLSPWRDTRKHSLPTPQCTSGITASQVSII